jgi:uncharacterized oxidoreductase
MKTTGNTVFITGGGSGIGRGLAEAFHQAGNQVIISGRRQQVLDATTGANPGMKSVVLDIEDPASIAAVAKKLVAENPSLNVLINNAGIMTPDDVSGELDDAVLTSTIQTNVYGPMRMTSALIGHLKAQPVATVINVSSGLAFIPLAFTAVYSTTKAAMHSYSESLRFQLRGSSVKVLELAPPYVQTELMGPGMKVDPRAMPLEDFIAETMTLLAGDTDEILVERVKILRNAVGPNEGEFVTKFNDMMSAH